MPSSKPKQPAKRKSPAIVRGWKRFFGVSCTHARHVDRDAWRAALKAQSDYNPHFTFHLGDFCDTGAFRSGRGENDGSDPVDPDLTSGLVHLRELEPQLILCGNHEQRLWRYLSSRNDIVAYASHQAINCIHRCASDLHAELVEYTGIWSGRMLGNHLLTHGTIYNVNAARDMAEMYGNVIFGHTHTVAIGKGRRIDNPTGYNIGALVSAPNMDYAANRRQTMAWTTAWVRGEYCDNDCRPEIIIHRQPTPSMPPATHA